MNYQELLTLLKKNGNALNDHPLTAVHHVLTPNKLLYARNINTE